MPLKSKYLTVDLADMFLRTAVQQATLVNCTKSSLLVQLLVDLRCLPACLQNIHVHKSRAVANYIVGRFFPQADHFSSHAHDCPVLQCNVALKATGKNDQLETMKLL